MRGACFCLFVYFGQPDPYYGEDILASAALIWTFFELLSVFPAALIHGKEILNCWCAPLSLIICERTHSFDSVAYERTHS